jgi:hypothetical protein
MEEKRGKKAKQNKGKGKGKAKAGNAQVAATLFAGKEYEDAVTDLISNTALQHSDFDLWMVKLLDALHFSGYAEDACNILKENLGGRTRDQMKNPRAYVFALLTKFKKDVQAQQKDAQVQQKQQSSPKSDFNADAPEFVPSSPCYLANFSFSLNAPEFVPGMAPPIPAPEFVPSGAPTAPAPLFALDTPPAPQFAPGSAPTTPQQVPKPAPYFSPEPVAQARIGQVTNASIMHPIEGMQDKSFTKPVVISIAS